MYNETSLRAAPLVAAALGRALGIKVTVSDTSETAYTDTSNEIVIPKLPISVDEDTASLLWGFIHHEAAHCRFTDQSAKQDPLFDEPLTRKLYGAIEDARIEAAHMCLYPGAERTLLELVKVLRGIDFWRLPPSDNSHPVDILHCFCLFYLRSTVLRQTALSDLELGARKNLEECIGKGAVTRLVAILNRVRDAESTHDSIDIAAHVRSMLQDEVDQNQEVPNDDLLSSDCDDDTSGGPNALHPPDSDIGEDGSSSTLSNVEAILSESDSQELSNKDLGDALADLIGGCVSGDADSVFGLPKDDNCVFGERDDVSVRSARKNTARLSAQLKRCLNAKKRVSIPKEKRGHTVARRHLHRVAFGDSDVMLRKRTSASINTALVLLSDASSSMRHNKIDLANEATLSTSLALDAINGVTCAAGAFPSNEGREFVRVLKSFDERTPPVATRFASRAFGTTPLAEALLWACDKLASRPENRKMIVVATDGDPDDVSSAEQMIQLARRSNIEVHGLLIGPDHHHDIFESAMRIEGVNQLASAYMTLMSRAIQVN